LVQNKKGGPKMASIPSLQQFFLETAPYQEFEIGHGGFGDVLRIRHYSETLDAYCMDCQKESVFKGIQEPLYGTAGPATRTQQVSVNEILEGKFRAVLPLQVAGAVSLAELEVIVRADCVFLTHFVCTRCEKHNLCFVFRVSKDKIAKIGQSPSIADLHLPRINKYRKVLRNDQFRELSKAIGLHAHGVGVGAFVYLRRIFEDLIAEARLVACKTQGWDEEAYQRGRMDDKILRLADNLPAFLVENRSVYSILSSGLHELTEEECLGYFEPVEGAIELILSERLAQREREEKVSGTTKAIGEIKGQIKANKAAR
jgi:hypothetical protein